MLTALQYRIIKLIRPEVKNPAGESFYINRSKIEFLLGEQFFKKIAGKVVLDFGCGEGKQSVELAQKGAGRVIGLDIREEMLQIGRKNAIAAGVQDKCVFATSITDKVDFVVSIDAFEHFGDPAEILRIMNSLLQPAGEAWVSFGPIWYHPLGGHLFSVFPWAHLVFGEQALLRWRADFYDDGASRFSEISGGLNQMTLKRFERLVESSPLKFASLEAVPIRPFRHFHNQWTREFTTSTVRCRLVKRNPTA